jgi:hypothetical protein
MIDNRVNRYTKMGDLMNKKWLTALSLSALLVACLTVIYINKPNEEDYVQWLSENYEVDCLDEMCYTVQLSGKGSTGGIFWNADGYYDSSTGFLNMGMQTKRLYRNRDNPNQFFSIEAKGFLGTIKEIEFQQNDVHVSRKE